MLTFLTEPIPHYEARKLIENKPAVAKDVFDALPDEIKGRAFTITGIEDMDVVQGVRDEIAKLPAGADWNTVKKEVMARISPWFTKEGAVARAQLIMSHHAFAAYSACQARIMDGMMDVFPYRQYLSTKDGKVRASHRALNEIILPADHSFWTYHTPPWEWNCRCQVVELTAEDKDEEERRDAKRAPENRRVLSGVSLNQLQTGSLNRGLSINVDVRTPKERGGSYQWSARDASLPYAEIRTRWDATSAAAFEGWTAKIEVSGGRNLLEWLHGNTAPLAITKPVVKAAAPAVAAGAAKPVSDALKVTAAKPEAIKEAIAAIDGVHSDGVLPEIPVNGNPGSGYLGVYRFSGNGTARSIGVDAGGSWPRLTTAHEIGHFLDHQAFGRTPGFASELPTAVRDIIDELKKTPTFSRITKEAGTRKARTYFQDPRELWARAYAQFIAIRSQHPEMLKELDRVRAGFQPWRQWPDDEFEPIRDLIENLFTSLQWMPKTKP